MIVARGESHPVEVNGVTGEDEDQNRQENRDQEDLLKPSTELSDDLGRLKLMSYMDRSSHRQIQMDEQLLNVHLVHMRNQDVDPQWPETPQNHEELSQRIRSDLKGLRQRCEAG